MSTINKVAPGAGAEWLLGGFALLRKAPLALGLLGLIWGLLSLLGVQLMAANASLGLLVQFLMGLVGPLLFAGLLWAVREVDQGRAAQPSDLFRFLRSSRSGSILTTLLPQVAAVLVLGLLLVLMIGPAGLQQLAETMAKLQEVAVAGGQPDADLIRELPVGRLFLWMLMLFVVLVAVSLVTFVAVPQIIFDGSSGLAAMRNSLRACLHNLLAMVVFYFLLFIALFALSFGVQLLSMVVQLAAGQMAAVWVSNLLLMAVLMPLLAGSVYTAWRQMLGEGAIAAPVVPATPPTHFEA